MSKAEDFHFQFGHLGIWFDRKGEAIKSVRFLEDAFGFDADQTSFGWNMNSNQLEIIDGPGAGTKGHFSILCDDVEGAKEYLEEKGVAFVDHAAYTEDGRIWKIFAKEEISGFAWHLALRGHANCGHDSSAEAGNCAKRNPEAEAFHFDFGHVGIWHNHPEEAQAARDKLADWFGFDVEEVPYAYHINHNHFEILKEPGRGEKGHFSILCDHIAEAKAYLEGKGVVFDENTCHYTEDGELWKVFAHDSISGFDWHLALRGKASNGH